jgi:hypothetical protein
MTPVSGFESARTTDDVAADGRAAWRVRRPHQLGDHRARQFTRGELLPADSDRDARQAVDMNWTSVVYRDGRTGVSLTIEPMYDSPDIVYVPDVAAWTRTAPAWARSRRDEILARMKAPKWHRDLEWRESVHSGVSTNLEPVPGSIESTPGGREFQQRRLFDPDSELTAPQARYIWHILVERFALAASGEVNLFVGEEGPKGTVFERIAVPALKRNPNVKIIWHSVPSGSDR